MHYDGSRSTPVVIPAPAVTATLRGVTGNGQAAVWIVGDAGTILYYDGTSWTRWHDAANVSLRGVWFDATTAEVWIAGDQGVIRHRSAANR